MPTPETYLASGTSCNDGKDNDFDGKTDCYDTGCGGKAQNCIESNTYNNCADNKDNDGDYFIDCGDPTCAGPPACTNEIYNSNICHDKIDNDLDGLMDCNDPDCFNLDCTEGWNLGSPFACQDNIDNDKNGLTDATDPICQFFINENNGNGCMDGLDNNKDGFTDCADQLCLNNPFCSEGNSQSIIGSCIDKLDNDADGSIDKSDPDCTNPNGLYGRTTEIGICSDNQDNDGDTFMDCYDSDCRSDPICSCLESDNQIDPRRFGSILFGGQFPSQRHDMCMSSTGFGFISAGVTPTLIIETFCTPGWQTSGMPTPWLGSGMPPTFPGWYWPGMNIYQPVAARVIDCKTVPGVVKGICQNGRCV